MGVWKVGFGYDMPTLHNGSDIIKYPNTRAQYEPESIGYMMWIDEGLGTACNI